jgi:hypothetical protein
MPKGQKMHNGAKQKNSLITEEEKFLFSMLELNQNFDFSTTWFAFEQLYKNNHYHSGC